MDRAPWEAAVEEVLEVDDVDVEVVEVVGDVGVVGVVGVVEAVEDAVVVETLATAEDVKVVAGEAVAGLEAEGFWEVSAQPAIRRASTAKATAFMREPALPCLLALPAS